MSDKLPVTILLVEDDPGHAVLIQKNLRRGGIVNEIVAVEDGQKAVDFLFKQGGFAGDPRTGPVLMLLDLNLPILDGYQVLTLVKNDERTRHIPIVILTTTDNPHEVTKCYDFGCNIYLIKPVDYAQFSESIRNLGLFLSIIQVPQKG